MAFPTEHELKCAVWHNGKQYIYRTAISYLLIYFKNRPYSIDAYIAGANLTNLIATTSAGIIYDWSVETLVEKTIRLGFHVDITRVASH